MSLLRYSGDVNKAPNYVLGEMEKQSAMFVTWASAWSGERFIAQKATIEKIAHNKKCKRGEETVISDKEIVQISNSSLATDEVKYELDATNSDELVIKEGFKGKEKTKITRKSLNLLEEVLYNKAFDYAMLFSK